MSREHKYRIWHIEHKVMFAPEALWFNNPVKYQIWYNNSHDYPKGFRNKLYGYIGKDGILMQSTGLSDKNGKEIYEGDVVKCSHVTSVTVFSGMDTTSEQDFCNEWTGHIIWQQCSCSYTIKHLTRILEDTMLESHEYEVIGNIHQHPHLLGRIT